MIEWEDLALQTAERFGGTLPHPETAAAIAAVHAKAPHAVERAIDRVAIEYEDGGIRSPWGILRSRVKQITTETAAAGRANDRDKTIARAEQWIRNAGLHYDRTSEIEHALFGNAHLEPTPDKDGQPITSPGDTLIRNPPPHLRQKLVDLWTDLRPIGEQIEQDAIDRGLRYQQQREELQQAKRIIRNIGNLEPNTPG